MDLDALAGPAQDNDLFLHMNLDLDLDLNPDFSRIQREVPYKLFSWFEDSRMDGRYPLTPLYWPHKILVSS